MNPYESKVGTIVKIAYECAKCLSIKPPAEISDTWGYYKTKFDGSETLEEIAENLMGDSALSSELVVDVNTGQKPTDTSCVSLFYPLNKILAKALFQEHKAESDTTLMELSKELFGVGSAWQSFSADAQGNDIVEATRHTVVLAGQSVFIKLREGDMVAEFDEEVAIEEETPFNTLKTAIGTSVRRWPARVTINFGIDSRNPSTFANTIRAGIRDIQRSTCIRFREQNANLARGKIRFETQDRGCMAQIGFRTAGNIVWMAPNCGRGTTVHEIGHNLGIFHEQTRSDRDRHIRVLFNNIPSSWQSEYRIQRTLGGITPYDFRSIMHYPSGNAMRAIGTNAAANTRLMGNRQGLSAHDVSGYNHVMGYDRRCTRGSRMAAEKPDECTAQHKDMTDFKGIVDDDSCKIKTSARSSCRRFCRQAMLRCRGASKNGTDYDCETDLGEQEGDMVCECRPRRTPTNSSCTDESHRCRSWARLGACTPSDNDKFPVDDTTDIQAFMEENCCRTCARVARRGTAVASMEDTCDTTNWPDVKNSCGDCTVLAENMDSKYNGTCGNYCRARGKICVSAQEDLADGCDVTMGDLDCEVEQNWENDDALCTCGDAVETNEPSSAIAAVPKYFLPVYLVLSLLWMRPSNWLLARRGGCCMRFNQRTNAPPAARMAMISRTARPARWSNTATSHARRHIGQSTRRIAEDVLPNCTTRPCL